MAIVYLSLGSNLGDRVGYVQQATSLLGMHENINIVATSSFYESEPWEMNSENWFVNAIVQISTTLEPIEGIIKPATPAKEVKPTRMEQSELQSKIDKSIANTNGGHADNQWYKGRDKRISNKVKITLRAENNVDQKEQTFTGSQAMLKHAQAKKVKITVLSVSYNNDVIDAFEIATSK